MTAPTTPPDDAAEPAPPLTLAEVETRDREEARALGAGSVKLPGLGARPWEDVVPLLMAGWEVRHGEICDYPHDWRLMFPAVRDGWQGAGGQFLYPPAPVAAPVP